MNLTEIHQIRPNHKLYSICDELCFKSKNLYNAALFEFRQSFFDKELDTLTWQNINRIFNQSNQFDYRELPSKVSNTVLKKLGNNISSFWSLIKKSDYKQKVRLPKYLHKTDGRFIVEFNKQTFSNKRDDNNNLIICKSSLDLRIPTKVEKPQQVRIIPKVGCYVIEVVYGVEENRLKQIKFKNEIISVPNLQLMKDCYNVKNEELFDAITSKHYEEINLDLFNMLNTHEKIYPTLIELLNKLKTLYLDEVHTYYKEDCIKYAEAEFEILCKDYSINSNDYVLCPVIFKNKLTWDIRSKNRLKLPTFYLLNHWSTHKAMKSISESAFRESLGSMVKPIEDEALRLECNSTVDKIVNESLKPIKKLNLSMRDLDNEIDFNGCKISVKTKDGKLTLKYKDYTFHVPYYSPNSVHTYFEKENGIEDNKTWVKTKEDIQTVADLFIEFLNS